MIRRGPFDTLGNGNFLYKHGVADGLASMRHQGVCNRHNDVITRFYISLLHPKNSDHNISFCPPLHRSARALHHPPPINFVLTFWVNHWMKADIKPKNKVRPILTVYCLNHIFLKLLWFLNSKNIATYFIMWHHICSSSAKWWKIAFVGSSYLNCWHH